MGVLILGVPGISVDSTIYCSIVIISGMAIFGINMFGLSPM